MAGWTKEDEWLNYTVTVASAGAYTFNARVASPNNNSKFHAEIDGVDVTGLMEIDDTGGWGSWVTVSKAGINLTAGEHVLKIVMDEASTEEQWIGDFDWFTFTPEGTGAITYDANGNMTSEGGKCYEYNEANKLKKVTQCSNNETIAEYIYNYKGQRMVKKNYTSGTLANTVISWSDSFETKDIVGGSIETTNYFFANGELVAKKNPDGSKVYFHNDHLGSTTLTTNQAGAQVEVTSYDPWGKILGAATQSKFLYTGQEHDSETGLHYYDARYYDPELKRFTQPDTIIPDVYNPQALNRYSYALNNPLKYTDPSGHWSIKNIFTSAVKAVQSAVKAVSTAVSSAKQAVSNFFAPKPPPVSTYRLPSTPVFQQPITRSSGGGGVGSGNNTSINVLGTSGGGGGGGVSVPNSQHPDNKTAQAIYDFIIGDDIRTIQDPNASAFDKGLAGISIVGNVVPVGKVAKVAKLAKFVSPGRLTEHFIDHGASMGYATEAEYLNGARKLFQGGDGVEAIIRPGDGAGLFYRASTNEFGIIGKNGIIRSYFDPRAGYWDEQLDKFVK